MKLNQKEKYISLYPETKRLLERISKTKTDKAQAYLLITTVAGLCEDTVSRVNKEKRKIENKGIETSVEFLTKTLALKLQAYRDSVSEYLKSSQDSALDKACEKFEQRNRDVSEGMAIEFYMYLLQIKRVIKNRSYQNFYDKTKGIADLTPKSSKRCFDIDQDSISKYIVNPHWWSDTYTRYTERGIKRYITQQSKEPLSSRDKEWIMGKYLVAHVDLTNADLHTIYLTQVKAKQFKDYWGFEEVEECYYEFNIPLTERVDTLPECIYFQTYPGVSREFTVYYYEGSDGWVRMISPTTLKGFIPNFDSLSSEITRFHTQGYIEAGKVKAIKEQKVHAPTMYATYDLNEKIEFMGEEYENKIPYQYTYQSLQEYYTLDQDRAKDEKKARAKEVLLKQFMYWTGLSRYETDALYGEYERYLVLNRQGKMAGAPRSMNLDRYYLWRERGAPRYERKHTSCVEKKEQKVSECEDVGTTPRHAYVYTN